VKDIPEPRRVHSIRYLRFYFLQSMLILFFTLSLHIRNIRSNKGCFALSNGQSNISAKQYTFI